MKKLLMLKCLTLAGLLIAGGAVAASPAKKGGIKVVYEKNTKYDFSGKSVDGDFLKPDGSAIRGDQNLTFDSMIKPRKNFTKELSRSSGALR